MTSYDLDKDQKGGDPDIDILTDDSTNSDIIAIEAAEVTRQGHE